MITFQPWMTTWLKEDSMDIVNYKRMQKLFNLCAKPALLRIRDAHLKENTLSFTVFLDRHKHRILHLYRLKNSCCPNAIHCQSPEKLPLVRNQWLILYGDKKNLHCNKSSCVCNVITNHVRAAKSRRVYLIVTNGNIKCRRHQCHTGYTRCT
jgi:hypothetical protein